MKSILLHIDKDPAMEARLQAALDLARAHGGHVTCLQAVSFEIFAPGDFYGSAMAAAVPGIKKAAQKLRDQIEARLAHEDITWDWQFKEGMAETKLLELSPLHDVIVIGPNDVGDNRKGPSIMAGQLLLNSKVPVLVIPADAGQLQAGKPVMVAWNGSSEACAALKAALPILKQAERVILANVLEEKDHERLDFPALDGMQYLSRHGVEAELLEIPKGKARVSDTLMSSAKEHDCAMIVMGAYGQSRLAELLLGGVTRRALSDPQMPMLLAH